MRHPHFNCIRLALSTFLPTKIWNVN